MDYNNEFKKIDSEIKAYFLGFAFADGCITTKKGKGNYIGYHFRLSLIDKEIIDKFKKEWDFFNYEEFDFSKYNAGNKIQYGIRKTNTQLYEDLKSHGLVERKSIENSHKLLFPTISKNLIPHFIRGYFDGNGSINISAKRPNLRRIEICTTSKIFLTEIKSILEQHNVICPIFRERKNRITPLFVLEWINTRDIFSLKNFFYKDCTISLTRKKEKFDSFYPIDKKENNPVCPKCFNRKVRKAGKRQMVKGLMLRYICVGCDNRFSIPAHIKQDELLENPEEDNQQPSLRSN